MKIPISSPFPRLPSGVRTIPMTDAVYLALKRVMKNRAVSKLERIIDGYGDFIFLDKSGMTKVAMHLQNYIRGIQKKISRIYGNSFPKATPHVLRHTFCTNMQQGCIDVKSLQYLMGHSNVRRHVLIGYPHIIIEKRPLPTWWGAVFQVCFRICPLHIIFFCAP
ncbi:MAG: tyrosine-type recombinase/integrase [Anaerotruncus colihominis]|nr:site-specific integrase [Anaerotruncus colihominis]